MGILGKRIVVAPLILAAAIASTKFAQDRIDSMKRDAFDEDLLFLPNDKLLTHFTGGLSSVVADVFWVRTIGYAAKEFHNPDLKFTWLSELIDMVVRLDPYFEGAYANGGMLLAAIGADDDALEVLQRGLAINPYSLDITKELIMVYLLNRRKEEDTPEIIGRYLRIAADLSEEQEHKLYYYRLASEIEKKHNIFDHAIRMWQEVLDNSEDGLMREAAQKNLLDLKIRQNLEALERVLAAYAEQAGNEAASLDDAIEAGILSELPGDESHGQYFIDAAGKVQNTVLLGNRKVNTLRALNSEMRRFNDEQGQYPESLGEWSEWSESEIPEHPFDGEAWTYDPETGEVR